MTHFITKVANFSTFHFILYVFSSIYGEVRIWKGLGYTLIYIFVFIFQVYLFIYLFLYWLIDLSIRLFIIISMRLSNYLYSFIRFSYLCIPRIIQASHSLCWNLKKSYRARWYVFVHQHIYENLRDCPIRFHLSLNLF